MKTYEVAITGVSDLCFGKHVDEPKRKEETHEQHEHRTWQKKVNCNGELNQCFVQPFAIKNGLESAARWLSMPIPGEGKKTFTKRFASGIIVDGRMMLVDEGGKPVTLEEVEPVILFVPSDGQRGSGRRVFRIFPMLHSWRGNFAIIVLDEKITKEVLADHLDAFGKFIGLGSMRVENGGINGRFSVESISEVGS